MPVQKKIVFLSCYFRLNACSIFLPRGIDLIKDMTLNINFSKAFMMLFAEQPLKDKNVQVNEII